MVQDPRGRAGRGFRTEEITMHRTTTRLGIAAAVSLAASAGATLPTEWTFELQARSSLNPDIPAFNLPQGTSLSSQAAKIDEDGGVAIRFVGGGTGVTEGIFYGIGGVGG
ncbi:MAG: hypothetical protein EA423_07890, partial [Phycisphaerales bacterium]